MQTLEELDFAPGRVCALDRHAVLYLQLLYSDTWKWSEQKRTLQMVNELKTKLDRDSSKELWMGEDSQETDRYL